MEDIFLRKEEFENEPWYNEFCVFLNIGVCKPEKKEYILPMQEAFEKMGYKTIVKKLKGHFNEGLFIVSDVDDKCDNFIPDKDNPYPLCDNAECADSKTCNISAHMDEEPYWKN